VTGYVFGHRQGATALKLAEAGAKVILVARGEEKLVETRQEIEKLGARRGSAPPTFRTWRRAMRSWPGCSKSTARATT